jgi:hypothetical protein
MAIAQHRGCDLKKVDTSSVDKPLSLGKQRQPALNAEARWLLLGEQNAAAERQNLEVTQPRSNAYLCQLEFASKVGTRFPVHPLVTKQYSMYRIEHEWAALYHDSILRWPFG